MGELKRRTRPWGEPKGPTPQADALAGLLRIWLDAAQLRLDDVVARLTPEHFSSGRVPGRSTIGERLAGVRLDDEFVQAIADICSGEDAALRERMLAEARALASPKDPTQPAKSPGRMPDPAALASELVAVQRRSLALQDKLMRAWERAMELDRERSRSHQMVMVLLTMVDKLQRDIITLHAERDRLKEREHRSQRFQELHQQLARSEEQRRSAEAELDRAREERSKADRLAEEAAEQIRALHAELERLRQSTGQPDNSPPLPAPSTSASNGVDFEAVTDDIDDALAKASRHLDDGARRLDQLACELHQDDPSDNSVATADQAGAEPDAEALALGILAQLRAMKEQGSSFVSFALEASADLFVGVMTVLLYSDGGQDDWDLAHELLAVAGSQGTPSHLRDLLAELRSRRNGDSYAYDLLNAIAANRSPSALVAIVAALRAAQQDADAYQLLTAVARVAPAWFISPIVLQLSDTDATWLIEALVGERSAEDIVTVRQMLDLGGHERHVALLSAPQDRKRTLDVPTGQTPPALAGA
ncbi:DivIVA domain-containing protein [Streptomyces sp. NPDC001286]